LIHLQLLPVLQQQFSCEQAHSSLHACKDWKLCFGFNLSMQAWRKGCMHAHMLQFCVLGVVVLHLLLPPDMQAYLRMVPLMDEHVGVECTG
jgi:hypothetical protein